ncbi:MAG: glycosyltransferase [Sphingobacteriaceae bacterium]|nr:MAG: glycosyltransferase [Sphingobacteriaceae bacterium]
MRNIKTSLNISTYNWPGALRLCLLSIKAQKVLPDEVVIADDGSTEETKLLIEEFQQDFPVPIKHIWHADEGFQLAKIRNRAIAASSFEYIIQIDGDLILHPKFIADHIAFSKKGAFVTGSRVILDKAYSERLLNEDSVDISLSEKGIRNRSNGYRVGFLRNYMAARYRKNDVFYMRGCNMAFWRDDLVKVNGYNEAFSGWGREDNEIAVRLLNTGIKKLILKFGAIVYHLYHRERSDGNLAVNNDILNTAITNNWQVAKKGLDQYL